MDGLKVRLPLGQSTDCEECLNICCAGPTSKVTLNTHDLARLLDAGYEHSIETQHQVGALGTMQDRRLVKQKRKKASLNVLSTTLSKPSMNVWESCFPTLRQDTWQTCTLLTEGRRCSIYEIWPSSCARYPVAYDAQNHLVFWAKGCRSVTRVVTPGSLATPQHMLVRAALEAYNEKIRDLILLAMCAKEVRESRLGPYLNWEALPKVLSP